MRRMLRRGAWPNSSFFWKVLGSPAEALGQDAELLCLEGAGRRLHASGGRGRGVVVSLGPGSSQQVQGRGHGAAGLLPGSLDRSPPSPTLSPEHLAAGHAHVPLTLWLSLNCRPRLRGPVPRHPRPEGSRSPPLTAGPAPAPAPPRPSGAVPTGGPESSSAAAWSQAGAAGGGWGAAGCSPGPGTHPLVGDGGGQRSRESFRRRCL